jgi:hypothetical protein
LESSLVHHKIDIPPSCPGSRHPSFLSWQPSSRYAADNLRKYPWPPPTIN